MDRLRKFRRRVSGRQKLVFMVSVLVWAALCCHALAAEPQDYLTYRQEALSSLQSEFSRIRDSRGTVIGMKEFLERLALIDEVAQRIMQRLQCTRSGALDAIVDDILNTPSGSGSEQGASIAVTPTDIYLEYVGRFHAPLPTPDIPVSELDLLKRYYEGAVTAAEAYLIKRGRSAAAVDKGAAEDIVELYILMPFLHVPDEMWSVKEVNQLPDWMRAPSALEIYEKFAIRTGRPLTAVQFARCGGKAEWKDADVCRYLGERAGLIAQQQNYRAAVRCEKARIEVAEKAGAESVVGEACVSLAGLYSKMGHPELAAAAIDTFLKAHAQAANWGQAAASRLRYLYEADQFTQIMEEAPVYQTDGRCKAYLPQIMYIAWVAYRHENKSDAAQRTQRAFLESFPDSPLCADMHFASAMDALVTGNYDEAMRYLEVIEYRYPDARIMGKVRNIKQRLSQVSGGKKE